MNSNATPDTQLPPVPPSKLRTQLKPKRPTTYAQINIIQNFPTTQAARVFLVEYPDNPNGTRRSESGRGVRANKKINIGTS